MPLELGSGNDAKLEHLSRGRCAGSVASMKWLAMYEDEWLTLYILLIFVVFICGLFLGAKFHPEIRPKEREPWYARHITLKEDSDATER